MPDVYESIILYCTAGKKSVMAADILTKMGYKDVKALEGGIGKWKELEMKLVTNTETFSPKITYETENLTEHLLNRIEELEKQQEQQGHASGH